MTTPESGREPSDKALLYVTYSARGKYGVATGRSVLTVPGGERKLSFADIERFEMAIRESPGNEVERLEAVMLLSWDWLAPDAALGAGQAEGEGS